MAHLGIIEFMVSNAYLSPIITVDSHQNGRIMLRCRGGNDGDCDDNTFYPVLRVRHTAAPHPVGSDHPRKG